MAHSYHPAVAKIVGTAHLHRAPPKPPTTHLVGSPYPPALGLLDQARQERHPRKHAAPASPATYVDIPITTLPDPLDLRRDLDETTRTGRDPFPHLSPNISPLPHHLGRAT